MSLAAWLGKPCSGFAAWINSPLCESSRHAPFSESAVSMGLRLKCRHPSSGFANSITTGAVFGNGSSHIRRSIAYGLQFSSTTGLDMGCSALIMLGAYGLVSTFDLLTEKNVVDQKVSRKLVHISSGLLFMMAWPLFSSSADARYIAVLVPLANCARLLIHGFSFVTNEGLVKAVSRKGKPEELLRGPMYYVIVLILCTTVFWRNSPIGMVSLAMMCGGDGIADIMGRRFGSLKLAYNCKKSWAGSISMLVFGFLISLGFLSYFAAFGFIQLNWEFMVPKVAIISIAATIVESLPITQILDDNISVPLTCILLGLWLFPL